MNTKPDDDLIQRLKEVFDSILPPSNLEAYPKEALPVGTYVRSVRHDKLGVITDAFYGDVDKDNQKIIIYTTLLFPKHDSFSQIPKTSEQYYVTNEYEYEVTTYLMMTPVDVKKLMIVMEEEMI